MRKLPELPHRFCRASLFAALDEGVLWRLLPARPGVALRWQLTASGGREGYAVVHAAYGVFYSGYNA
jgi:hypothetical protein